jgi:hypothetical protein
MSNNMASNQPTLTLKRDAVMTSPEIGLNEEQRNKLVNAANSVCKIEVAVCEEWTGTGFHLGGGWVMTNYHVIVDDEAKEETFRVSEASFKFPGIAETITAKRRPFICTRFEKWNEDAKGRSTRKDLALIYVPELLEKNSPVLGLYNYLENVEDEYPPIGQEVCLLHYGGSGEEQFSFGRITKTDAIHAEEEWKNFYVHNAYCPDGSSGAPLLWFNENGDLVPCGVNYMGPENNEVGHALPFRRRHWICDTVTFASEIVGNRIARYKVLAKLVKNDEDIRKRALEEYRRALEKLDQDALTNKLLVFLDENLQDVPDLKQF